MAVKKERIRGAEYYRKNHQHDGGEVETVIYYIMCTYDAGWCGVGWVDIGTVARGPLNVVVYGTFQKV
jgi:hypothetical protein